MAVTLTSAQLTTLQAFITANAVLAAFPLTVDGHYDLSVFMNAQVAVPDFWTWRSAVSRADIYNTQDFAGNFWDWTTYKNQGVAEQNAWTQMFMGDLTDFTRTNLRSGIAAIFTGSAAATDQRDHCFSVGRALATWTGKCFAVTSLAPPTPSGAIGSETAVATPTVTAVTPDDVQAARNLP